MFKSYFRMVGFRKALWTHFQQSSVILRGHGLLESFFGVLFVSLLFVSAASAGWDTTASHETGGSKIISGEWRTDTLKDSGNSGTQQSENSAESEDEQLDPGTWELAFGLDNQLFPSAIIALSTLDPDDIGVETPENSFGSPLGMASVFVRGKAPGDSVTVEISSTKLIKPSRMTVVLEDADTVYEISPHLKYEYEKLLSIRQPYPEDVTAKVYLNDKLIGEKSRTIIVRSINDCFYGLASDDGTDFQDWTEMFAAYVNEGDPIIDGILSEALKKGYVDSFLGYQGTESDVKKQVKAIWKVLKDRGIKYSNIVTTSVESDTVLAQHVRLVGESNRVGQANCVDGSVLFASVFRKLGLKAYLVLIPGHMLVGVSADSDEKNIVYIETTMLAEQSFDDAVKSAEKTIQKCIDEAKTEDDQPTVIHIDEARDAGILPLRDLSK